MLNMACERWWFSCYCVNLFIIALGFSIVIAERGDSLYHYDISSLAYSDNAAKEFIQFYPHDEFRRKRRSSIEPTSNTTAPLLSAITNKPSSSLENIADTASNDIDIKKFGDITSSPLSESNILRTVDDTHEYYNSSLYIDEIAAKKIWINMDEHPNVTVNNVLSNSHRRAWIVELSFDFPFYGQPTRNVTISTGGFLYTGDYVHSWLAAAQYIAPLMANFDTRLSDNSYVKYADNGTAFTVEWENVVLQEQPKAGGFTFQVTLHKNGDIVFIYAAVPLVIDQIQDNSHPVKVGLSDAYIIDRTVFLVSRKTIYEYHRVNFKKQDIKNWTVIYLKALPTCVELDNCNDCLSRSTGFECKWCPSLNRCSTGTDRHRQDWMVFKCELNNIKEGESCPAINNKTTTYDEYEHDIQAVHEPEGSVRGAGVRSGNVIQPGHEADAPETSSSTIALERIPSRDELLQNLPKFRNILGRFASSNISSTKTEDVEKPFRDMCEKNGGPAAYSTAENSVTIFPQCIQSLINVTELKSEIEAAKPRGELNIVFEKYCPRVPNLERCIRNMTDSIESCLASDERDNIKIISNIIDSFLEFICHDDGDRITMFITAGGTECFQSQQQAVMECANQTFSSYIPTEIPSGDAAFGITSITKFVWSRELCKDIEIFRTCTIDALEECRDPTAAYVVDSLFNYVKRATPCNNLLTPEVSAVTGQKTEIGAEKIISRTNQSIEIESQPSEVSNFSVECLESTTKNAKEKGKEEKSKEELSNLSKFFLNMAETVETFPKIYQIEIKSQVFELVTKYERQMILASEKSDKEVPLNATLPVF